MSRTLRRFVWIAAAGLLAVSACTKKSKSEYGLDIKDTLRVNIDTEPPTLDWQKATDTTSAHVNTNLADGLTAFDLTSSDLGVIPALAASWTSSKNASVWTFKIRKGAKWTDGREFVAQDMVSSWERLLNPKTASEYAYFLSEVKGAKEYNEGKLKDFSQVGVKATDANTLVVELIKPLAYFPAKVAHHSTYPVRVDVVEKHGDKWTDPANIVTIGAYKLKIWEHDKALVLERNEDYYGAKGSIKNVICYMITELSTAMNLVESGKLDAMLTVPASEMEKIKTMPEYEAVPALLMYYYGFNVERKPMDNPLVRKAIASAIDRTQIVEILRGGQTPLTAWIPAGMFGHESQMGMAFNADKAKGYLKQAGFEDVRKLGKITIAFNTNENHKRIAENIQAQLKKNLGLEVELQNLEWKVYLDKLKTDPPHIWRMGWSYDYPDPSNGMDLMLSYSEQNRTRWKNHDYDKLVETGNATVEKEKRRSLYSKAQQILVENDVPAVPLYNGVNQFIISKRVKNFPKNALFLTPFKAASIIE